MEEVQKLYREARQSSEILYSANTAFPFTLFPDTISIDREKLTLSYHYFFKVARVASTPLDDIEAVDANVGPFFGSLRITSRFFVNNIRDIRFLWRNDTEKIQGILQGYKLAKEKDVDLSEIDRFHLVEMLCELGKEPKA